MTPLDIAVSWVRAGGGQGAEFMAANAALYA